MFVPKTYNLSLVMRKTQDKSVTGGHFIIYLVRTVQVMKDKIEKLLDQKNLEKHDVKCIQY